MKGYYEDVVKKISAIGYYKANGGKGSHEKWCNDNGLATLTVPRGLVSKHTANGILKDAGLPKAF